jgi:phenylacetate-CoA ligase
MRKIRSILIKNCIFPIADYFMETKISYFLSEIKRLNNISRKEVISWQNNKLKELVSHSYENSFYYKKLFRSLNLTPDDINSIDDLKKIPILTKKDIRDNFKDLIPCNINKIPHKTASTGGSSGNPLIYLLDNKSWSYSVANTIYNWERTNYNYGDKYIALGSSSLFVNKQMSIKHKLYYKLKNKIGLSGINMSDDVCKKYIQTIRKRKIRFIYGYASSIYLLAKYTIENKVVLDIDSCFTTSEVLTNNYRIMIESAFNCNIVDCYGAKDGGITAFAFKEGFYEVGYNSLVFLVKNDSSEFSEVLLTDLFKYSMPLINYKLGDLVTIDENNNEKYEYNGQLINSVDGRSSEIIYLENGSTLTGPGFTILFKDLPVEYYFIEKKGLNTIECSIIRLSEFDSSHESIIRSTFRKQMGENSTLKIHYIKNANISSSVKDNISNAMINLFME